MAIFYIFNELEIASHSFAMTEWPFFKGLALSILDFSFSIEKNLNLF